MDIRFLYRIRYHLAIMIFMLFALKASANSCTDLYNSSDHFSACQRIEDSCFPIPTCDIPFADSVSHLDCITNITNSTDFCCSPFNNHQPNFSPPSDPKTIYQKETLFVCYGDSLFINDQWIANSQTISNTYSSSTGGDSIHQIQVEVLPNRERISSVNLCPGNGVFFDGTYHSTAGTYCRFESMPDGCDSLICIQIGFSDTIQTIEEMPLCGEDWANVHGYLVNQEGSYTETFTTTNGCDSISTLILTRQESSYEEVFLRACEGDSSYVDGIWYHEVGFYTIEQSMENEVGCDSIVVTYLDITHSPRN